MFLLFTLYTCILISIFRCAKASLCPSSSVCRLVGWLVGRVTHSLDDPHVAPYWPTWPCSPWFEFHSYPLPNDSENWPCLAFAEKVLKFGSNSMGFSIQGLRKMLTYLFPTISCSFPPRIECDDVNFCLRFTFFLVRPYSQWTKHNRYPYLMVFFAKYWMWRYQFLSSFHYSIFY